MADPDPLDLIMPDDPLVADLMAAAVTLFELGEALATRAGDPPPGMDPMTFRSMNALQHCATACFNASHLAPYDVMRAMGVALGLVVATALSPPQLIDALMAQMKTSFDLARKTAMGPAAGTG